MSGVRQKTSSLLGMATCWVEPISPAILVASTWQVGDIEKTPCIAEGNYKTFEVSMKLKFLVAGCVNIILDAVKHSEHFPSATCCRQLNLSGGQIQYCRSTRNSTTDFAGTRRVGRKRGTTRTEPLERCHSAVKASTRDGSSREGKYWIV